MKLTPKLPRLENEAVVKFYAVIDTNVLVSAMLKWDSIPGRIISLAFLNVILNSRVLCITTRLNHTFSEGGSLGSDVHLFGYRQEGI